MRIVVSVLIWTIAWVWRRSSSSSSLNLLSFLHLFLLIGTYQSNLLWKLFPLFFNLFLEIFQLLILSLRSLFVHHFLLLSHMSILLLDYLLLQTICLILCKSLLWLEQVIDRGLLMKSCRLLWIIRLAIWIWLIGRIGLVLVSRLIFFILTYRLFTITRNISLILIWIFFTLWIIILSLIFLFFLITFFL